MAHKFGNCPKLPSSLEKKLKASEKVGCRNSRPRRRSCGHCGELLSLKTYRRHYKKNYDTESGSWMNTTCEVSPNASHTDDLPGEPRQIIIHHQLAIQTSYVNHMKRIFS